MNPSHHTMTARVPVVGHRAKLRESQSAGVGGHVPTIIGRLKERKHASNNSDVFGKQNLGAESQYIFR
jgi:hypothetical protein